MSSFPTQPYTKVEYAYTANVITFSSQYGVVATVTPSTQGTVDVAGVANEFVLLPDGGNIILNLPAPIGLDGCIMLIGNADLTGVYSITLNLTNGIRTSKGALVSTLTLPLGFGTYQFGVNNGVYQDAAYNITNMNGAAPLASPALTGAPTAPTAAALTNNTQLATTAFSTSAVGVETSRAEAAEALLAPLASPALTGNPTATTQTALNNSTRIATTAYTDAAVGVETSRATTAEALLAPKASPTFTGVPVAPTATALTSTTQLATTAFTTSAVSVETTRAEAAEALALPLSGGTLTGNVTFTTGGVRSSVDPSSGAMNNTNNGYTQSVTISSATTFTNASPNVATIVIPSGVYGTYLLVATGLSVTIASAGTVYGYFTTAGVNYTLGVQYVNTGYNYAIPMGSFIYQYTAARAAYTTVALTFFTTGGTTTIQQPVEFFLVKIA
jgi:hypothetical protein